MTVQEDINVRRHILDPRTPEAMELNETFKEKGPQRLDKDSSGGLKRDSGQNSLDGDFNNEENKAVHAEPYEAFKWIAAASLPTPEPDSDDDSDDGEDRERLSCLAFSSPSDTAEAQRNRKQAPLFGNLEGHGLTTYGPVPDDRSIEVDDVSTFGRRKVNRSGRKQPVAEGSTNGYYLQDRIDLQILAEMIAKQDIMKSADYRLTLNEIEGIHARRNSWPSTEASLKTMSATQSTWLNETWGPPIRDEHGNPIKPARPGDQSRHPSHTRRLSAQYSGQKRKSDYAIPDTPAKKQLKKKHKRYTWPAGPDIYCVRPDEALELESIERVSKPRSPGKKLIIHPPKPNEPLDGICTWCRKKVNDGTPMWGCLQCFRRAYCSLQCRDKREGPCSYICERQDTSGTFDVEDGEIFSSSDSDENEDEDDDECSTTSETNEIGDIDGFVGVSPSEMVAQVKAMQEFECRKLQRDLDQFLDDIDILNYRIIHKGRTLQYEIMSTKSQERLWQDATDLQGPQWTVKMANFWYDDPENTTARRFLQEPEGDNTIEPAPFGRFILRSEIVREREIVFEFRNFEKATPEGVEQSRYWSMSHELGQEWDEAIAMYWIKCRVAHDWEERKKMVEGMSMVTIEARNDSVSE